MGFSRSFCIARLFTAEGAEERRGIENLLYFDGVDYVRILAASSSIHMKVYRMHQDLTDQMDRITYEYS